MTSSIPLSSLPVTDEIRRDRYGRYLVLPEGADKLTGYTRATTAAKSLDNGGGLANWKAAMAMTGLVIRRGLRSQFEALLAATGGDAWYFGEQSKKECKRLVEECAAAGGAAERRDTGTALHTLTALHDVGRPLGSLTAETERDVGAYTLALANAGVEIVPGMVEVTVVLDSWKVAGTFDRLVTVPWFDRPLIADLKCGADLSYSWQSIAVQLAAYSRANSIYVQGPAADGSQDKRLPMPDVDQDNALVIWCNAGTGECTLHLIDIASGWEAFVLSMHAREWRKAEVSMPLADGARWRHEDELAAQLEASVAALAEGVAPSSTDDLRAKLEASVAAYDPAANIIEDKSFDAQLDHLDALKLAGEVREWLQRRVDVIGAHANAKLDLARSWPPDTPTLLRFADHTPAQLEAIEVVLGQVEKRHRIVFPDPKPGVDLMALIESQFPGTKEQSK